MAKKKADKEKAKRFELGIEMKNFGPITSGKIDVKPMTIFIGPNNSGKSYAAILIHAFLLTISTDFYLELSKHVDEFKHNHGFDEIIKYLNSAKNKNIDFSVDSLIDLVLTDIYELRLCSMIQSLFSRELPDLVRIGNKRFEFKLITCSKEIYIIFKNNKLKLMNFPKFDKDINIDLSEEGFIFNTKQIIDKNYPRDLIAFKLKNYLIENYFSKIIDQNPTIPINLPAGRCGFILGSKIINIGTIALPSFIEKTSKFEKPIYAGYIAEFLSSLSYRPNQKGFFYDLSRDLENEMIAGEIVQRSDDKFQIPEIVYKTQDTEIPLYSASSTVSEIAPLIIYLKNFIEPGSTLIFEEPEAHLHPGNQLIMAKYLVRLMRKGVNLIITTHSEYLLEKIGNLLQINRLREEGADAKAIKERYGYTEDDYIKKDELAVYRFPYDKKSKGYIIKEVEISDDDGISLEEYFKIHQDLHDESIKLQVDHDSLK
jgi:hypothetical protein